MDIYYLALTAISPLGNYCSWQNLFFLSRKFYGVKLGTFLTRKLFDLTSILQPFWTEILRIDLFLDFVGKKQLSIPRDFYLPLTFSLYTLQHFLETTLSAKCDTSFEFQTPSAVWTAKLLRVQKSHIPRLNLRIYVYVSNFCICRVYSIS